MTELRFIFEESGDPIADLEAIAEGWVAQNALWFAVHPGAPEDLVRAGVRYDDPLLCERSGPRVPGFCQGILNAGALLKRRKGTCIDLALYYAGLWRVQGLSAGVRIDPQVDHYGHMIPEAYHCVVIWDPARRRGRGRGQLQVFDASEQVKSGTPLELWRAA